MKYTIEELNEWMDDLQYAEKEIRIDRGKRYGSANDTLGNISTFGPDGAIIHANECYCRIKNMFGKEKNYEDLRDAVMDARNYLAYILNLEERKFDDPPA